MYEIGYKGIAYYRDRDGVHIYGKYRTSNHYQTEEEAIEQGKKELPMTLKNSKGEVVAYRGEVSAKAYKYETDHCPSGYCVCPRCCGTGVYGAPSRYTDTQGVKFCFHCNGMGMVKERKHK